MLLTIWKLPWNSSKESCSCLGRGDSMLQVMWFSPKYLANSRKAITAGTLESISAMIQTTGYKALPYRSKAGSVWLYGPGWVDPVSSGKIKCVQRQTQTTWCINHQFGTASFNSYLWWFKKKKKPRVNGVVTRLLRISRINLRQTMLSVRRL